MSKDVEAIKQTLATLKEVGVDAFLWAGTLLGAYREGDFIKGDSDVDIAYLSSQKNPREVAKELAYIYRQLHERDFLADYFDENWQKHKGADIKTVFGQAHLRTERPFMDFFTLWNFKGQTYDPWYGPMGFTLELGDTAPIKDIEFPVPKNTEKVLEFLYGDWKTPKKEKGTKYHKFGMQLKDCCGVV